MMVRESIGTSKGSCMFNGTLMRDARVCRRWWMGGRAKEDPAPNF